MATSFHLVNNNAASTLASAIDDNDLSAAVATGGGAEFDTGKQYLTLGRTDSYAGEIVDVTSRSSDTFTIASRAADGTTATSHDAGDTVECLLVAAHITEIQDAINGIENGTTTLAKVITSGTAANKHTIDDSATNTVVSVLELYKTSSGTPASGIGAKVLLGGEDSAGNEESAVEIHGYLTTVTNSSEQGAFLLRVKNAGSFMDALAITVASNTTTIGSNQTTANLWNTTATTVNAFGAGTAIAIGATSTGALSAFHGAVNVKRGSTTAAEINGLLDDLKINNTTTNAVAVQYYDFTGTGPNTKVFGFFRFSPAAATAAIRVFNPNTTTQTFSINANTGDTTIAGALTVNGSGSVFGDASTDTFTFTGRLLVRSVTDAGPMTATGGTQREIVFNTSDSKFYGCTVTHASAATWAAFN